MNIKDPSINTNLSFENILLNQANLRYLIAATGPVILTLHWHHNEHNGVSDHQPHDCLLNHLFMRRSRETSKLHVTGLCAGNSPVTPVNFPHKGPVTWKMFPFDDVIMNVKIEAKLAIIGLCDLEIGWMSLKKNWVPLLCLQALCIIS